MNQPNNQVGDYTQGIETMHQLWGEEKTAQMRAIWSRANVDVERYITAFALGEIWSRPGLDLKTRSLIVLAASVAAEREAQVRLHTHGALTSGATPQEVMETIIQLFPYAGFAASWQALVAATEVIGEFRS